VWRRGKMNKGLFWWGNPRKKKPLVRPQMRGLYYIGTSRSMMGLHELD
jgi:hypothetical protein